MKKLQAAIAIAALWVSCGYIARGLTLGHFTHQFPESDHRGISYVAFLAGPMFLVPGLIHTPLHWRTHPMSTEERWRAFHREFPELTREYFERNEN